MRCDDLAEAQRNGGGRLRTLQLHAVLTLGVPAVSLQHLDRVLAQFESFCPVRQSVGQEIAVVIEVFDSKQLCLMPL